MLGDNGAGGLICPPDDILDVGKLEAAVDAAFEERPDNPRDTLVTLLRDRWTDGKAVIETAFRTRPSAALETIRSYCWLSDAVIVAAFRAVTTYIHPAPNPTEAQRLALLAVGGYGREEMAPFSDIDLLFLTASKPTGHVECVVETLLYTLWDLKMKVGHATRTVEECLRQASADLTVRTALLEKRLLAGDEDLYSELDTALWDDLFSRTPEEFTEGKLAERDARHEKQGNIRFVLEPNVKEGKGGLRDLQTLFWIGKYLTHKDSAVDLVREGFLTVEELKTFVEAGQFLWSARCALHLAANRPVEQLTFDMQVEVAALLGYEDKPGRRAVEQFMQEYFRHSKDVGDLTRIFLAQLEARNIKRSAKVAQSIRNVLAIFGNRLSENYVLQHGRLSVKDEAVFLADPRNMMRLFRDALETEHLIHPDAMRLIARNLHLASQLTGDSEANRIFLELLVDSGNPERALRRMNEMGVLGAFMPEFGEIVAMMQFNMYHSYTVDEHTIQCISCLNRLEEGELVADMPIATEILKKGVNRRVLYVALLLHDIGKGRPQDHSELGAEIAATVAPRLGLDEAEVETVIWLVRNHLLMSDVAQKRDLSDPRTAQDFARAVQSTSRLNLLLVLTVCDINGVGPGVWNNWKAMLLRDLYRQTRAILQGSGEASIPQLEEKAKEDLAAALGPESPLLPTELERHYSPYWLGFDTETHVAFAQMLADVPPDAPVIRIDADKERDATRTLFAMSDHPGIFSRLAGALALSGASVVDARTYTTQDGLATVAFWVQDAEGHPFDETRLPRLKQLIQKSLQGKISTRGEIANRHKIKKREAEFRVPTTISFDNDGSERFTIIEVETRDRLGLLHDLTRALTACNVTIASAQIATYGEEAVDVFYVKDLFGLKIWSESKKRQIESKIRASITAQAAE
ncbi:[protein-PII] uridylyltransferase [Paracoccaceae bacterium GXU_MW_L88]